MFGYLSFVCWELLFYLRAALIKGGEIDLNRVQTHAIENTPDQVKTNVNVRS